MKRIFASLIVLMVPICFVCCSAANDSASRSEVTLYGVSSGRDVTLNMVFDLENCGRLCDKPTAIVLLKTPSESINPWTGFSSGDFFVLVDSKNNSIVYGSYSYKNVMAAGEKRVVPAFRRQGSGEKAIGGLEGNIFLCAAEQDGRKIIPPAGNPLVILMTKGMGKNGKWAGRYDGKLYRDM